MIMKRNFFLLLLTFLTTSSFAKDALPLDTVLARLEARISECLEDPQYYNEADSLLKVAFAQKGAKESGYYPMLLYRQSNYYLFQGDMPKAKPILLGLLRRLPDAQSAELNISVPHDLGLIYRREDLTDSALFYYERAIQAATKQNDKEWEMAICVNVGVLHYNLGHYAEAERYLAKAISIVDDVDDPYTELCAFQVMASAKMALHELDEAEANMRRALQLARQSESIEWQVRCLTSLIGLFVERNQTDSAAYYVERGNALLPQLPPQNVSRVGYIIARANHYYRTEKWREALDDFMATQGPATKGENVLFYIANCYGHLGQWHEAFCYMDSARMRSDTIASQKMVAQVADFNVKYRTMEKDLEIERLHSQRLWFTVVAVVVLLLVVGLWLWFRLRRQRREAQMRINTLEDERKRIAKELHDGLCNDMLALEMQMQWAQPPTNPALQERLGSLRQEARQLSHQLMPPEFDNITLPQLLTSYVNAVGRATGLQATLSVGDELESLDAATSHELYRIVQEHTSNILKGHTASRLAVTLQPTTAGHYQLVMTDDGQYASDRAQGMGHRTLRDRITAIGGRSRIYQTDGQNVFEIDF